MDGLPRRFAPRNDGVRVRFECQIAGGCDIAFSRHDLSEFCVSVRPLTEGAGKAGCALHPRSRVPKCASKSAHEHTGSAEAVRLSLRDGVTAYFALSLVTGLFCHHRPQETSASRELDASVGASGPHDFAVHLRCVRLSATSASTASHRNVRDDRERPSYRVRRPGLYS
jgi:hypothetical protein